MTKASIIVVDRFGNEIDLVEKHTKPMLRNPNIIDKAEAVARCGITEKQFDALVKEGVFPRPFQRGQWNRKILNSWMDARKLHTDRVDPGWVYFIEMGAFIKAGWSTWPASRRDTLQTSCPYDLIILGAFPGSKDNEAQVHDLFKANRTRGEWFKKSPGLLAYIAWLKVVWRGNPNVIPGELDNVVPLVEKTWNADKPMSAYQK